MPRARPLRTSTSATAALAAAAAAARKASKVPSPPKDQAQPQEVEHTLVEVQTLIPAKVKKLAKSAEKSGKAGKNKVPLNTPVEAIPSTSDVTVEDLSEGLPGTSTNDAGMVFLMQRLANKGLHSFDESI